MTTLWAMIAQAKLSQQLVTIRTDDGERVTGTIEKLTKLTVTLRQPTGIMYIPYAEIEAVTHE
ncbi:hypothetical protein [Paenibacillus sp. DMB5]|uniref:hypothetical protein n=1 Tax=Paenibacillus sp. DMB5 TaxID=1780103 RepID=UPI00076D3E0E|nr:hypothetical protein [Paenibacillus sp. DMB5]KUP26186.1 hypothetical protein AWJ19_25725 [Paenibacillus sp. DMB5]KUP26198.1 hypothetical protein AWJ19_25785 [Paenibacillus sp. DMB5]KUP26210.1 hypothetical protein AWJ19_25845 [Paenibacillus sp. DMB5]